MDFNKWNPFWATCFGVMGFLIIVGNSLTIATLLKKKFRKGPHLFLISLAFADLLVGCTMLLYVVGMVVLSHKPEVIYIHFSRVHICYCVFHIPFTCDFSWKTSRNSSAISPSTSSLESLLGCHCYAMDPFRLLRNCKIRAKKVPQAFA